MGQRIEIREAAESDIPFLIEAIICAEKSGTDKLSYCTIFDLDEAELRTLLAELLSEDITGQELCVSGFLVAEVDSQLVGAVCSWVEAAEGKPSTILKGNLLLHFFGRDRILAAAPNLKRLEALSLERTPGALQLESVYVPDQHRGQGICGQLLDAHEKMARAEYPDVSKAEIVLAKVNDSAYKAYARSGFAITRERQSSDPKLLELLPATSKVLMEKPFS